MESDGMLAAQQAHETEYTDLLEIEPIKVKTPYGPYMAPRKIDRYKMPANLSLSHAIFEARERNPRQRILTSGESYQIRERLQRTNPDVAEDMISLPHERTSTILDFEHGEKKIFSDGYKTAVYFDGFLIQIPEVDDKGNLVPDKKGILDAMQVFKMPLPTKDCYVKDMLTIFDRFNDTIFGLKGAREKVPGNTRIYVNPEGLRNLYLVSWRTPYDEDRHLVVNANFPPLGCDVDLAARAASDDDIIYLI